MKVEASPDVRVGIVVIGRNEGERLQQCLSSLLGLPNIVYADSASTDDSVTIARASGATVVELSEDRMMTAARGRNAGVNALRARQSLEYIQFIDGDCELIPGWLDAATAFLDAHPEAASVCGRRMERKPEASIYNKLAHREWDTPIGQAESTGGDALVRLSAFLEVGGFRDDQLAHEEPEFCSRLRARGWQIWRIAADMTTHDAATFHVGEFYRRSRRAGMGMTQALLRSDDRSDSASRAIVMRALIWGLGLPALILCCLAIDWRLSLAISALYPLQWVRLSVREYRSGYFSVVEAAKVAALSILGKFAEADGAIRYASRHLRS